MILKFIELLELEILKGLPGEDSHSKMAPINRARSSLAIKKAVEIKESAVGIHLFPNKNSLDCILIQRPIYNGSHSGQISFPGGKKEKSDPHFEFTARRESFEEIGIPISNGKLIGELTQVYIPVSNFVVKPFIFFHNEIINFIPDSREVQEIFKINLKDLDDDSNISEMDIQISSELILKDVPYFNLSNKQIWGATALILNELKDLARKIKI
jgi:8-oxo-dGTP pyrophosphatase MutT (NUDIX family)